MNILEEIAAVMEEFNMGFIQAYRLIEQRNYLIKREELREMKYQPSRYISEEK